MINTEMTFCGAEKKKTREKNPLFSGNLGRICFFVLSLLLFPLIIIADENRENSALLRNSSKQRSCLAGTAI